MSRTDDFDVYVGGKTGTFTGVKMTARDCLTKNVRDWVTVPGKGEVTTVSWGDDDEREILVASGVDGTRSVEVYDTDSSTCTCTFRCDYGRGKIVGISRYDEAILTAVHTGEVKLWRFEERDGFVLGAGANLERMRHSRANKHVIATGGFENQLRLFDLNRQRQIFIEKNLSHDWLQLRVPVWISDIDFLPDTELVATVSRHGHVRLYDPKTQRRPVVNLEMKDEALTTLAVTPRERQIIVGSGKGRMNLVDLRSPAKSLNTYKGFVGGVTGIVCSKTGPYVVSVGLDRHLRVHHVRTKRMLRKIYLTSKLSCVLLRSDFSLPSANDEIEEETVQRSNGNVDTGTEENDSEYDVLFDSMPVIGNETNGTLARGKKRKLVRAKVPREIVFTERSEEEKGVGKRISNSKRIKDQLERV
ncbi:WD repeat-containing protein 74 [Ceratina calcarata]|uniref:WD repeat-containing protein 74 n=1 Tax=Ceratina calcarata TaxID=156304 RepID=A0AAJ7JDP5_9HYME|nr:WD repeat-containing protein 74 [Ceratina calcarata]